MRNILAFTGFAHAVTLDRLGQYHGGSAGRLDRFGVGRVNLVRIVSATIQAPDILVRHVGDHVMGLGILAEKMFARVGAALGLVGLVLAIDGFFHEALQLSVVILGKQVVPVRAPDHLYYFPACAAKHGLQFLDDFTVAAYRAVEALQVTVNDENQVIQRFARGQRNRAERFGLVHFAVTHKGPDLAVMLRLNFPILEVLHETRLVNRHDRPQPHRNGGELPEVRHQPGMRIGGEPVFVQCFLAERSQLLLAEAPLEEGARVNAGRRMPLEKYQVTIVDLVRCTKKMHKPDVVKRCGGSKACDMPAELARFSVGVDHHRRGVPADHRANAVFDRLVTRDRTLHRQRYGVDVGGGRRERQVSAGTASFIDQAFQ